MKERELKLLNDLFLMYGDKFNDKFMEILDGLLDELVESSGMRYVYENLKSSGWNDYVLEELGLSVEGWED